MEPASTISEEDKPAASTNRSSTETTANRSAGRSTATLYQSPPAKVTDKSKNNGNSAFQSWSSAPTKIAIDPAENADSNVWRRKKPGTATETGSVAWATPAYSPRSETKTDGTSRTELMGGSDPLWADLSQYFRGHFYVKNGKIKNAKSSLLTICLIITSHRNSILE